MFITAFDAVYMGWGSLLLKTLGYYHPDIPCTVISVELSEDEKCLLKKQHKNIFFHDVHLHDQSLNRPTNIANSRPIWLLELFEKLSNDWFLFLDADLILRNCLDDELVSVSDYDAAFILRPGLHNGVIYRRLKVAAGLIYLNKSSLPLIETWCEVMKSMEPVEDVKPGEWFWEQTCLYTAIEMHPELNIKSWKLPRMMSSPPFSTESYFWSANVKAHEKPFAFAAFSNEVERLLD